VSRPGFALWRKVLVATLPADLSPGVLDALWTEGLAAVRDRRAQGLVLDASAVDVMDAGDWAALCGALRAAALLGARGAVAGLRPGLVHALIELGAPVDGVRAFGDVESAVAALGGDR
jgi:rsbT antagonist protein RsbS